MAKEYGKIYRGEEEPYSLSMFPIEGNAMKVHRKYPASNSRRMAEALALALFDIKGRIAGEEIDVSAFRNEDNERLEHAILMAFDPFTNDDIMEIVKSFFGTDELTEDNLRSYYKTWVRCLIRIRESVDFWIKEGGPDGYFEYLERFIGDNVDGEKMDFILPVEL